MVEFFVLFEIVGSGYKPNWFDLAILGVSKTKAQKTGVQNGLVTEEELLDKIRIIGDITNTISNNGDMTGQESGYQRQRWAYQEPQR